MLIIVIGGFTAGEWSWTLPLTEQGPFVPLSWAVSTRPRQRQCQRHDTDVYQ